MVQTNIADQQRSFGTIKPVHISPTHQTGPVHIQPNTIRTMQHFYKLSDAITATGKPKTTLLRDIKSGVFSAQKDDKGRWKIDPAEIHRVYPKIERSTDQSETIRSGPKQTNGPVQMDYQIKSLERELEIRDEKIEALEAERRRERENAQAHINDLRDQIENNRQDNARLHGLLTDQTKRSETRTTNRSFFGLFARG